MVCCVFQLTNLVNNYQPRKSARTFASKQKASNKLYMLLAVVFIFFAFYSFVFHYDDIEKHISYENHF
jgi:uncharacterized membrane protein